jgi:hypothetical protein
MQTREPVANAAMWKALGSRRLLDPRDKPEEDGMMFEHCETSSRITLHDRRSA